MVGAPGDYSHIEEWPKEQKAIEFNKDYVEKLEFIASEMQMCLKLMLLAVSQGKEMTATKHTAIEHSNLALKEYHELLSKYNIKW